MELSSIEQTAAERENGISRQLHKHLSSGVAALLLCVLTFFLFQSILVPPAPDAGYPWGSDTMGHLVKVEALQQGIAEGDWYPDLFPGWYMGQQMFRYYPPLPYYLLALLARLSGDLIVAGNWFVVLCALFGGLAWLPYQRWIGLPAATVGALFFLLLPDNIRVAMAEGNLPRTLAAALLPLALYLLLRALEGEGGRLRLGLALLFSLIVLSHAMMAAIYALCAALFVLLCCVVGVTQFRRAWSALAAIALGLLLSGWWLIPSLTGGITELNASAMTEALAVFPLGHYLNPAARSDNPETIYVGVLLLLLPVAALFLREGRSGYPVALTLTGLMGVLITTPGFNDLFNALPMHHLFWPLRFLGIASFLLLLALMWQLSLCEKRYPLLGIGIVCLLTVEMVGSLSLLHTRPPDPDVAAIGRQLEKSQGWRQATLDLSRLGSMASYFFLADGKREQLFGWAYQGARTARNVAAINEATETGNVAYLLDRLDLFGTDDVVLLNSLPSAPRLAAALDEHGFEPAYQGKRASLLHRDGEPRAVVADWPALGIGRSAQNIAYLFPQLVVGSSSRVDDYSLEELLQFETIVLSGFGWRDRVAAEQLVQQAAAAGARVVVDLTGTPQDPLARIPRFLDVWGERLILLHEPVTIRRRSERQQLLPIGLPPDLWYTHTPQGMHREIWHLDYLGERAALIGYNQYGEGRVWFVGLNLPYHVALTHDPVAIKLLEELLLLPPDRPSTYRSIPLIGYEADQNGYRFRYILERPERLLVPVAYHDGMTLIVDGRELPSTSLENLLLFEAPAGSHQVEIKRYPTAIYRLGQLLSLLALAGLGGLHLWQRRKSRRETGDQAAPPASRLPSGRSVSDHPPTPLESEDEVQVHLS